MTVDCFKKSDQVAKDLNLVFQFNRPVTGIYDTQSSVQPCAAVV